MTTVLIVEDEPNLASLLEDYLHAANLDSQVILDGLEAQRWLEQNTCDFIILDLMLPGLDGVSLCRWIRQSSQVPIMMATAKVEEIDRLLGLEIGADDYLCKPYSPREVVARVKAILRRSEMQSSDNIELKTVKIDLDRLSVDIGGTKVLLTAIEMRLFELLFKDPGKIFSRQYIMDNIYNDYRIVSDRTVDSHIKKMRRKLHDADPDVMLIHSIYGAGYKYEYQNAN